MVLHKINKCLKAVLNYKTPRDVLRKKLHEIGWTFGYKRNQDALKDLINTDFLKQILPKLISKIIASFTCKVHKNHWIID